MPIAQSTPVTLAELANIGAPVNLMFGTSQSTSPRSKVLEWVTVEAESPDNSNVNMAIISTQCDVAVEGILYIHPNFTVKAGDVFGVYQMTDTDDQTTYETVAATDLDAAGIKTAIAAALNADAWNTATVSGDAVLITTTTPTRLGSPTHNTTTYGTFWTQKTFQGEWTLSNINTTSGNDIIYPVTP